MLPPVRVGPGERTATVPLGVACKLAYLWNHPELVKDAVKQKQDVCSDWVLKDGGIDFLNKHAVNIRGASSTGRLRTR